MFVDRDRFGRRWECRFRGTRRQRGVCGQGQGTAGGRFGRGCRGRSWRQGFTGKVLGGCVWIGADLGTEGCVRVKV